MNCLVPDCYTKRSQKSFSLINLVLRRRRPLSTGRQLMVANFTWSISKDSLLSWLFGCFRHWPVFKIKCHVIANKHVRSPLRNVFEAVLSQPFPGLVKGFTCTFTAEQVLVETSHEFLRGCVFYGPPCRQH